MILTTTTTCKLNGRAYPGIPLLILDNDIVEEASDFLRHKVVRDSCSIGTAKTYADDLSLWFIFLKSQNCPWRCANDNWLLRWRDIQSIEGIKASTINRRVSLVFHFYYWAQINGIITGVVKTDPTDSTKIFPFSSKRTLRRSITTPLLFPNTEEPNRHTLAEAECQKLDEQASRGRHAYRNILIMMWFRETGLRRAEALSLKTSHIPHLIDIERMAKLKQTFPLKVVGKGSKSRILSVPPSLMEATRLYIENDRKAIVKRRRKNGCTQISDFLFLSERGTPIQETSLSNALRILFLKAGIGNASGHRLRARYLKRLAKVFVDQAIHSPNPMDMQTVWLKTAEAAGHSRPDSLFPYVGKELKRVLSSSKAQSNYDVGQSLRIVADLLKQWASQTQLDSPSLKIMLTIDALLRRPSVKRARKLIEHLSSALT